MSDTRNRYDESHNLKFGVVQAEVEIPYHSDESRITITEHHGTYWFSMGSLHGPGDITVEFDEVRYDDNVLWFEKGVGDGTRTTAHIDWHLLDAGHYWGLVGEWFRDRLNLDEYRTGAKCPECESEILNDGMFSGCENLDCDVFFEGVPDDTWPSVDDTGSSKGGFREVESR